MYLLHKGVVILSETVCKPIEGLYPAGVGPSPGAAGAGITLKVTAKDKDGNILSEECKDGDLYLRNWGLLLCNWLRIAINTSYAESYKPFNISGDTWVLSSQNRFYADPPPQSNHTNGGWGNQARVRVGSSQVAPDVMQYDCLNYINEVIPTAPAISNDGNTIKLVFTAVVPVSNETTFAETALKIRDPMASNGNYLCITRDNFTPVIIPAGGSLTLQYEFWFNAMPV